MPRIEDAIGIAGAFITVRVQTSPRQLNALRRRGRALPGAVDVLGLVDTGASCSAIDGNIIRRLGLATLGRVSVHTPSTGHAYVQRDSYLASITLGADAAGSCEVICRAIECELASEGFFILIGRDVLSKCILTFDGPADRFVLEF